jgi:protein-S-isoprenylcysteine O-methyltransferase Ste14
MYVGMVLLLLAWALHLAALPAWLGPVAYILFVTRFQIVPEERVLDRVFGDAYAHYKRHVRRWL